MKLDYIHNVNEFGDNMVRLYDFNSLEANKFRDALELTILKEKKKLDLTSLEFIQARNCILILRISLEDIGIVSTGRKKLFCDLTIKNYEHMVGLLEPFCRKETKGYQWLYDIDSPTDFLFSPGGTW